jgi:SWI/SNF-related matrix-associated actin-dependent regulator 1 of chromatin subfamily A
VAKAWWTVDSAIAARLSEYADAETHEAIQAVQEAKKDAQNASVAVTSVLHVPAPPGLAYRPFQLAGIEFMASRPATLLADEMGCIDGQAIVSVLRAGAVRKHTLADAYKRFNGLDPRYRWDPTIKTYIKSLQGDVLLHNEVKAIVAKGERLVVEIALQSGKRLTLTPEHEIAVPGGQFVRADRLSVGDAVLTNGTPVCATCGSTMNVSTYPRAKFRGHCRTCIYRKYRTKPTWIGGKHLDRDGYVLVSGLWDDPRADKHGCVREHIMVVEEVVGQRLSTNEQVHHIDGNRANNDPTNLEIVTCSEHHQRHNRFLNMHNGIAGKGGTICFVPKIDRIVSIATAGVIPVYDVVMADPHRNFVVNGVVVHNCGKSVQALGLINLDAALNRVLIVCPASLRVNWAREAARWLVKPLTVGIADSSMLPDTDIVIVNYDRLTKLADQIRRRTWDLLIADESHYAKSPKAQRSKALYNLTAKKTLFLTGTPLLNRPDELYPQVHYLTPTQFPNWWWYVNRYCGATKGRFGLDTSGATHLDELRDALAPIMIRRTKAQVLTELPPKIRQIIPLAPNGSEGLIARQWEAWRRYEADVKSLKGLKKGMENASYEEQAARLKEGARTAFADVTRMRQEVGLAKVPAVIEAVRSAMEAGKVVVFAHHQSVQNALMAEFGASGVLHRGGLSDQEKQAAVDRFQHDPGIKVFIGSIRASGVGLTLTASSHIIFAEQDWTPAVIDQCESRCHRIGQQESLLVQHLVFDGSLDATMVQRQVEKQDVIDQIMEAA